MRGTEPEDDSLLAKAEQATGTGSFEQVLRTGHVEASRGLRRICGLPATGALSCEELLKLTHPDDVPLIQSAVRRAIRERKPFLLDIRLTRPDGEVRTLRSSCSVTFDGDQPSTLVGTVRDVTEEVASQAASKLLSLVVQSSGDGILTSTAEGTITSWNQGAERLYQYTAEEAIDQSVTILEPEELAGEQLKTLARVFSGQPLERLETEHVRKDGGRLFVSLTISPVHDAHGRIISAGIVARDTTDQHRYEEKLRYLADHDQLTGLYNRRRFEEELKREFARAGRYDTSGAVVSIDLDSFKAINDSAGHAAGDAVLVAVADAMRQRFRTTDTLARIGGDEFAVLLANVDEASARSAAEDLLGGLRSCRPTFGGKALKVHASIGVAMFNPHDATAGEMQISADLAMYTAKKGGGDRVTVFTPQEGLEARSQVRQPWSERIRDALDNDRFVLHFQPILDLASGQISHGELLLRMRDVNNRLIAPGNFLPTVERAGLIHELDRWVVRRAISLLAAGGNSVASGGLGINLSGASVTGDQHLLGVIEEELDRTGVDPRKLIFEVTETAAIANMPEATSFARDLTRLGCCLALDDFGIGFSSFYYLKHLPVRYIKLDGEFIQNLPGSKVDEHVVRAIVDVAQSMDIKTVAESVADDATIALLRKHSVDYAQGFHIGRPMPIVERRGAAAAGRGRTSTATAQRRQQMPRRPA